MNKVVIVIAMIGGAVGGHLAHEAGVLPALLNSGEKVVTESVPHIETVEQEVTPKTTHYGLFQRVEDGPKGELIIKVPLPHTVPPGTSGSACAWRWSTIFYTSAIRFMVKPGLKGA